MQPRVWWISIKIHVRHLAVREGVLLKFCVKNYIKWIIAKHGRKTEGPNNLELLYLTLNYLFIVFLFRQFWHANSVIRMKVAILTEVLQGQTGGEKDQKCRKRLQYVVVQVYMSSPKVLRYPPVSITVPLQARAAPSMAKMFMWSAWSGDKMVSVYVCQVVNT